MSRQEIADLIADLNALKPLKQEDQHYLTALNKADSGDIQAFVNYIEKQLKSSLETSIKAARGENIEEEADLTKKIKLIEKKIENNLK